MQLDVYHGRLGANLLHSVFRYISAISEGSEQLFKQWMFDRPAVGVGFEIPFGHIGRVTALVDQNVIPGLVLGWTRAGNRVVPLVGALEGGVNVIHDTPVVEAMVMDDLADEEICGVLHGTGRW